MPDDIEVVISFILVSQKLVVFFIYDEAIDQLARDKRTTIPGDFHSSLNKLHLYLQINYLSLPIK